MRIRIEFAKTEAMRFTGHLDLHRAWERSFRRAGLPLAYSQGYNPRPRLNLASALPLGFTSQAEIIDARLEQELPLEVIHAALERALPPGLRLLQIEEIDLRAPAPQTELQATEYEIRLLEGAGGQGSAELNERVRALLGERELPRQRRGKTYDLRPLILELHTLPEGEDGRPRLFARLAAREGATGRPEEVLAAMGLSAVAARIQRTRLIFERKPA
jgi:radical SAM-linked protein